MNLRQKRLEEKRLIQLSIAIGSLLTAWAIVTGILGDSKSIIFDALFSLVGISLSGVSLFVNNFVRKPDDDTLPFGRSQFQPFAITLQSSVIIFLCLYSMATSIIDVVNGGKSVQLDVALPYLIVSIGVCFTLWLFFRRRSQGIESEYVRIEATEWQLDALLSFGILVGLSMGFFLKETSFAFVIPYIDPGIVIIVSGLFLRIPVTTFWKNLRELLQFAPDDDVEEAIHDAADQIKIEYNFLESLVRVAKTGGSYVVEIDFLLPKEQSERNIADLDLIRQQLYDMIKGSYEMWLTISFTTERKWML